MNERLMKFQITNYINLKGEFITNEVVEKSSLQKLKRFLKNRVKSNVTIYSYEDKKTFYYKPKTW
jgi:hypothetical protein